MHLMFLYLVLCLVAGSMASKRALGFWGAVILSVVFTPVIVLFGLLVSAPHDQA